MYGKILFTLFFIHVSSLFAFNSVEQLKAGRDTAQSVPQFQADQNKSLFFEAINNSARYASIETKLPYLLTVRTLLQKGFNVDTIDSYGLTGLSYAIEQKDNEMTLLLIGKGANLDATSGNSKLTPRMVLDQRVAISLIGTRPTSFDDFFDLIHSSAGQKDFASKAPYLSKVRVLLLNGFDVNTRDRNGYTGLHHAIDNQDYDMAFLLMGKGANLDVEDSAPLTPRFLIDQKMAFAIGMALAKINN